MNFAYAQDAVNVGVNMNAMHAITNAGLTVQFTLLILVALSVVSWTIIFAKHTQLKKLKIMDAKFEEVFWRASSLDDIFEALKDFQGSAMAQVFKSGYLELRKLADAKAEEGGDSTSPVLTGLDNLDRALRKSTDGQLSQLESRLSFLATTGSTGPFIGLFGTVWGIMGAFQKIGATGMASLAVVAPGISEALIATAIGLFAAIPATIGYNHFIAKIKRVELNLNSFSADFLNIAKRNFFRED